VVLAVGALLALTCLPACERSRTTHTSSESLATSDERIAFLGRYVDLRTPVRDAAFHIDYQDNSGGFLSVPGPSDWTIWTGMLLPHGALSSWLADASPCKYVPDAKLDTILPAAWGVSSPARCLDREGTTLLAHDAEDVLVLFARTR
jgi:hypothetical protein